MTNIQRKIDIIPMAVIITMMLFIAWPAIADDFQSPPKDYLFENNIDDHQETKFKLDKDGNAESLTGSLYIILDREEDGQPVYRHPTGDACRVKNSECIVGWSLTGLPGRAKFLYHNAGAVNGTDHAVWMWNRVDLPQPRSYTHFHWIGADAGDDDDSDPRAPMPGSACDKERAGELIPNSECNGWFIEIRAVREFLFEHGNEIVLVRPGLDNATHLNLVTNYFADDSITKTR